VLEDPGTGIQVRHTLLTFTYFSSKKLGCKYLTRRFTAIPNACTCTPNTHLHQTMVTYWCSLRRRPNDDSACARRRLRAARRWYFAVIRTPLNPSTHSLIDCTPQSPMPPLYRTLRWLLTAFLARVALSTMGFWWIDVETVSKKRSYVPALPPPT
jgi:hypothetical protein